MGGAAARVADRADLSGAGIRERQEALKAGAGNDLLILDARGFADQQTVEVAQAANIVLLPTGLSVDDLRPSVRLAHELATAGIPKDNLLFALCRTGDSAREIAEARLFVEQAGYACLRPVWPERAGYRHAHDEGRTGTEARHPSLKAKAEIFAKALTQAIDRHIKEKTK
jgi:chromosome partitioning protein